MFGRRLISRRRFLTGAGYLAATPYFVPITALGSRTRRAPSERLNLGIIGLKKMGGAHVRNLLKFGEVQILAVCDVDRDLRDATKRRVEQHYAAQRRDGAYRGCDAYNEYERIMARSDIDAVVIAVPEHWHAIIAVAAARARKDIYCEKPLALTIGEARAMVRAVRRHEVVLQTGSQQRSSGNFRRACELVRNGCIGEIQSVHVQVGPVSQEVYLPEEPTPAGFDYERWLGPAPWAPYNRLRVGSYYHDGWRRIRAYSGGKMTDWGAHHFDIVQWGLGMDDSGPVEIIPPPPRKDLRPLPKIIEGTGATPLDPSWGLKYRYANGVEVIKDHNNGLLFVGREGKVEVNRGHLRTWPENLRTRRLGPNDRHLYRSPGHYQDWIACIRARRRPICDVEIGCRSVTVCHLGNIACWLGRTIHWDPVAERIVGDEQAARWLDRPKRAPYRL